MTAKQTKTKYNKEREKPLYPDWTTQPNRTQMFSRADKTVKDTPAPTVWSHTKSPS